MGERYIDKIELTEEEVNRIKSKAINSLPLNPTAQGWSGSQIRQRMAASITDGEDSLLFNLKEKLHYIKKAFGEVESASKWYYGHVIKQDNLEINLELIDAYPNDFYLNNTNGDIFICVNRNDLAGIAVWSFVYNIKD